MDHSMMDSDIISRRLSNETYVSILNPITMIPSSTVVTPASPPLEDPRTASRMLRDFMSNDDIGGAMMMSQHTGVAGTSSHLSGKYLKKITIKLPRPSIDSNDKESVLSKASGLNDGRTGSCFGSKSRSKSSSAFSTVTRPTDGDTHDKDMMVFATPKAPTRNGCSSCASDIGATNASASSSQVDHKISSCPSIPFSLMSDDYNSASWSDASSPVGMSLDNGSWISTSSTKAYTCDVKPVGASSSSKSLANVWSTHCFYNYDISNFN